MKIALIVGWAIVEFRRWRVGKVNRRRKPELRVWAIHTVPLGAIIERDGSRKARRITVRPNAEGVALTGPTFLEGGSHVPTLGPTSARHRREERKNCQVPGNRLESHLLLL